MAMHWQCKMISAPVCADDYLKLNVGDMWLRQETKMRLRDMNLSKWYFANNSKRAPLFVVLPGMNTFCLDGQCYSSERGYYDGWEVTGEPPTITVKPSINLNGRYHGFVVRGVISADTEGRVYTHDGLRELKTK